MSRALFVSDIHIAGDQDPKYEEFCRFLDFCLQSKPVDLFLVGDVFDLWIADRRYFVTTYSTAIEKIRQLVQKGVRVHYFEGNHDLDLRVFWQKLGVYVYEEATYFKLGENVVRVEHGDQMDPSDKGYLFLRALLRTRLVRMLGRLLPNFIVRWIGERASRASRDYTTHTKSVSDSEVRSKIEVHVEKAYQQNPFDVFVSGHVHVALDTQAPMEAGHIVRCFNLGTWLKEPLVLELNGPSRRLLPVTELYN